MKTEHILRCLFAFLLTGLVGLGGCFTVTDWEVETTEFHTFNLISSPMDDLDGFDVLIVVDASRPSLDFLAESMGGMGQGIMNAGLYDLPPLEGNDGEVMRIGVITSDLGAGDLPEYGCTLEGDNAGLRVDNIQGEDCFTVDGTYLKMNTQGLVTNMEGGAHVPVPEVLSCILRGQAQRVGCVFRQPMLAAIRALDNPANSGFFRQNAALAIIFMTTEDDCSTDQPQVLFNPSDQTLGPLHPFRCFEYGVTCDINDRTTSGLRQDCASRTGSLVLAVDDLHDRLSQRRDLDRTVVARVSGPTDSVEVIYNDSTGYSELKETCVVGGEMGYPSIRLTEFADKFEEDGVAASVCEPQLNQLLMQVSARLAAKSAMRCVPRRLVDMDDMELDVQPDCQVWDVTDPDGANEERIEILPCRSGSFTFPCYAVESEVQCDYGLKMQIYRSASPPNGSIVEARCLVHIEDPAS